MRRYVIIILLSGVFLNSGCSNNPGAMSQTEVEARLKQELKLKDIQLSTEQEGGYRGTGKTDDGKVLTISITQKPEQRLLWYTAKDEKGELQTGFFQNFSPWGLDAGAQQQGSLMLKIGIGVIILAGAAGIFIWRRRVANTLLTNAKQTSKESA